MALALLLSGKSWLDRPFSSYERIYNAVSLRGRRAATSQKVQDSMVQAVDKSGDRVRKMFAEIAPRYDLMNHLLSMNIDRMWRSRTVRELRLDRAEPILDVCTGTGDLAIAMSKKVAGKAPVVGMDFCGEMLKFARKKQEQLQIAGNLLRFEEADTQSLPMDDNSCQAVTVAFGLRNVADTDRGLLEMIRVCRPGGQVAVLEFSKPSLPGSVRFTTVTFGMYCLESVNRWPKMAKALTNICRKAFDSFHVDRNWSIGW